MNQNISILYVVILVSGSSSCIEFFHPDLDSSSGAKYVVDGQVTDQEGYQTVSVSMTSSMEKPNFNPVSFCDVNIIDNQGNTFQLKESIKERGFYSVWMGKDNIKPGISYQVKIMTPTGVEIVSDFDQLQECPKIDSVYYIRKDYPTPDPDKTIQGLQFYIDFKINTKSQFFRWEVIETWEHHAVYPITWYKDANGNFIKYNPYPNYSKFTCWTTEKVKNIFTLSTENVTQSNFTMKPLNYVGNQTQRLTYCYSMLVNQYAVSESAFKYWEVLRKNSEDQGGLYNTQPIRIKGNLRSTANPDLEVLGFFCANSVRSKRIFVLRPTDIDVLFPSCAPPSIYTDDHYKIEDDEGKPIPVGDGCVECYYLSGTTVKPNYWPY